MSFRPQGGIAVMLCPATPRRNLGVTVNRRAQARRCSCASSGGLTGGGAGLE
jgi:hypothetical protein